MGLSRTLSLSLFVCFSVILAGGVSEGGVKNLKSKAEGKGQAHHEARRQSWDLLQGSAGPYGYGALHDPEDHPWKDCIK